MSENFLNNCFNYVTTIISYLVIFYFVTLSVDNVIFSKNKNATTDESEIPSINILQIIAAILLLAIIIIPIWHKSVLSKIPIYILSRISLVLYATIGLNFIKTLLFRKDTTPLDNNEHHSLFIFILLLVSLMQKLDFSQFYTIASASGSQTLKVLLLLFILYSLSSIVIFSLIIYPSTFWATVILKFDSRISSAFRIAKECFARKLEVPNEFSPLCKRCLPLYKRLSVSVVALPICIALDLLCYMLLYAFQIFIVLPLAIIVYIMSICGSVFLFVSQKIAKLSPRRALFFSFRCSIVLASTLVVITVRVLSEGHPDTVASIVEFIASVIVIPIVFQWIQGILKAWREKKA